MQCILAGGRTDEIERYWLLEILDEDTTFESMANSWPLKPSTIAKYGLQINPNLDYAGRFWRLNRALNFGARPSLQARCFKESKEMERDDQLAGFPGRDGKVVQPWWAPGRA